MVSTGRNAWLGLVTTVILLAGCADAGPRGRPAATPGIDAEYDEGTGAIEGQVVTSEFEPVQGADVGLLGSDARTTTGADGRFALSHVGPGDYTIVVVKLGFEQATTSVRVEAGRAVEGVEIMLHPLPLLEPHEEVFLFQGFITCSIGTAGVLSEECGQGLQTEVGTFGGNDRNKIDWKFNVTKLDGLQDIYLELDWVPASAAARKLGFNVAHGFKCTPNCEADLTYCRVFENFGPPVQKCEILIEKLGVKDPAKDLPWDITARAWAAPVPATDVPNIVLEQSFTMYRTEFYDLARPEGYSAVPA